MSGKPSAPAVNAPLGNTGALPGSAADSVSFGPLFPATSSYTGISFCS
jgi:hypothetical protein